MALPNWGCEGQPEVASQTAAVTNEPLIDGSREENHIVQRASRAEESADGDSSSGNGSTSEPPASGTPERELSPIEQDAQHYAEQYGIELSEAVARLMLQEPIGEMGAAIEANEKDTFAGLWIQHEPDYRVVVAFTRDGESTISKYVQDGPLLELIEVRTAEVALRDLERAQLEAGRIVGDLGFQLSSGIDVKENRVELYVADRAVLEEELRESGKTLPDRVVIIGQ